MLNFKNKEGLRIPGSVEYKKIMRNFRTLPDWEKIEDANPGLLDYLAGTLDPNSVWLINHIYREFYSRNEDYALFPDIRLISCAQAVENGARLVGDITIDFVFNYYIQYADKLREITVQQLDYNELLLLVSTLPFDYFDRGRVDECFEMFDTLRTNLPDHSTRQLFPLAIIAESGRFESIYGHPDLII